MGRLTFSSPFAEQLAFAAVTMDDDAKHSLHSEEANLLGSHAVPGGRLKFSLGRIAARRALAQLRPDPPPVLRGAAGEPLWPEGIVGSITHCGSWAVALAARSSVARSIGVDLENSRTIQDAGMTDLVCHPTEAAWVMKGPDRRERLTMLFSAKESVFKALYPLCRRFMEFTDVRLSWVEEQNHFRGRLLVDLSGDFIRGHEFEVECRHEGDFILTYIICPVADQVTVRSAVGEKRARS